MFIMALEDVVKGFGLTQSTVAVAERNQATDAKAVYDTLDYLGLNDDELVGMENNPQQVNDFANYLAPLVQRKALDETKANIDEVLGNFDADTLSSFAVMLSPDGAELKAYSEALEGGNYDALKGLLVRKDGEGNLESDSLFNRLYLPTARPDQLAQVAVVRRKALLEAFVGENLSKVGDGEDATPSFDKGTAVSYVSSAAEAVGDQAYLAIGAKYVENASGSSEASE